MGFLYKAPVQLQRKVESESSLTRKYASKRMENDVVQRVRQTIAYLERRPEFEEQIN